jgi:serine/threonine-protein kinase
VNVGTNGLRALSAIVLFVCAWLAGCASDATLEIHAWTLADDRPVVVPGHVEAMPDGVRSYVLRSRVTVPDAWRGQPLTLAIPYLEAPVRVVANGVEAAPMEWSVVPGAPSQSAHAFRVNAELTRSGTLELSMLVERASKRSTWIDAVPRLSATPFGDRAFRIVRTVNGPLAVATFAVLSTIGFTYLVLFFFDRRRHIHLWWALQAMGVAYYVLERLGLPQALGVPDDLATFFVAATTLLSVFFVHAYFEMGRPAPIFRWWLPSLLVVSLLLCPWFSRPAFSVAAAISIGLLGYQLYTLARLYRQGRDRYAAASQFVAWLVIGFAFPADAIYGNGGGEILGGAHTGVLGLGVFAVIQATVLGRDHVRSLKSEGELNIELRRQIADRSQRLADALARIGAVPEQSAVPARGEDIHGRYRIVDRLGEGGMGAVFEVERLTDGRHFALKVLTSATTGVAMARLAREAQIAAQVSHENLVAIADVDVSESGVIYLVMELVDGPPLQELRYKFGDVAWAKTMLRQIARGLAALHARGVVHRDLKPSNVLVDRDGVAKIADLGIARIGEETTDPQAATMAQDSNRTEPNTVTDSPLTATGAFMGTPLYMAPELARGVKSAGPSSDIWSLGVIGYELVANRPAFASPPVLDAMAGKPIEPPHLDEAVVGARVAAILMRCLDLDEKARPTAAEVAAAFEG